MSHFPRRCIISSFKLYDWCKARWPKREVIPCAYNADHVFYFFSPKGRVRHVDTREGHVYIPNECAPPMFRLKVICDGLKRKD